MKTTVAAVAGALAALHGCAVVGIRVTRPSFLVFALFVTGCIQWEFVVCFPCLSASFCASL